MTNHEIDTPHEHEIVPSDATICRTELMDLAVVTFVVSVKGGKLVLRPQQANALLVAFLASQATKLPISSGLARRAVLITATHPGGVVEDVITTTRKWFELTKTLADDVWFHAKSYPGCGDHPDEDHAFVLHIGKERADNLARRWGQVCYLDIDLDERPDGRPKLVFPGAR